MAGEASSGRSGDAGMEQFDVCIIGAGTFGSCTAYHLSKNSEVRVCLIGPGEPAVKDASRTVFGCHYDEGRITRIISGKKSELTLALNSTLGYAQLELESGVRVFSEVGYAIVGGENEFYTSNVEESKEFCAERNIPYEILSKDQLKGKWDGFDPVGVEEGMFVPSKGGHVSIRNLVTASQKVAIKNGVERREDVVTSITREGAKFLIRMENRDSITCGKVCITTGSFTNFFGLLPKAPDIKMMGHTVMKFEIDEATFERCKDMPSINFCPSLPYVYVLPPIRYPNGKVYIKLGHSVSFENPLTRQLYSHQEVLEWYCLPDYPEARAYFCEQFKLMFPKIEVLSTALDHCVMGITATGRQYLGFAEEGCFVAVGGNGVSAKMGLEIGRIVADSTIAGTWRGGDLDEEDFKIVYKN